MKLRGGKYNVQVSYDGVEWHAVTQPVTNKNVALNLASVLNASGGGSFRAFNRYTRRETQA